VLPLYIYYIGEVSENFSLFSKKFQKLKTEIKEDGNEHSTTDQKQGRFDADQGLLQGNPAKQQKLSAYHNGAEHGSSGFGRNPAEMAGRV